MSKKTVIASIVALVVGAAAGAGGLHLANVHAAAAKQHWVIVDNTVHPDGSSAYELPAARNGNNLSLNRVPLGERLESFATVCKGDPKAAKSPCWVATDGAQHPSGNVEIAGLPPVNNAKGVTVVEGTSVDVGQDGAINRVYVWLNRKLTAPRDYRTVLSLTKSLGTPSTVIATSAQWIVGPYSVAVNDDGRNIVAGLSR
ncbi:TPA: hypothetical protein QDB35_000175 [Burkholderia vietnamiensis]|nr:hypothetical protein [Burkholderia vietnamiensis]